MKKVLIFVPLLLVVALFGVTLAVSYDTSCDSIGYYQGWDMQHGRGPFGGTLHLLTNGHFVLVEQPVNATKIGPVTFSGSFTFSTAKGPGHISLDMDKYVFPYERCFTAVAAKIRGFQLSVNPWFMCTKMMRLSADLYQGFLGPNIVVEMEAPNLCRIFNQP